MESKDGEIDRLEKGLLADRREEDDREDEEPILYSASFQEAEDDFVKLKTAHWILYSLLLLLAWGFGVLMLLYTPLRRHILRRIIRSRKLYVTHNAIVYKVTKPFPFPCLGALKKEKYVLLPSVADVVIEQGYLQSHFGVYSIRIESAGVRRPPSDDVQIEGIANPREFRKAVLSRLSNMRSQACSRQISIGEDVGSSRNFQPFAPLMSPSKSLAHDPLSHVGEMAILQKLEEVGSCLKVNSECHSSVRPSLSRCDTRPPNVFKTTSFYSSLHTLHRETVLPFRITIVFLCLHCDDYTFWCTLQRVQALMEDQRPKNIRT